MLMNTTKHDHNREAMALAIVLFACLCGGAGVAADSTTDPLAWPPATKECRPWSYWWWLGSAVDKENLTKELTRYRDAGWGGVHIIPIYGAKGWEDEVHRIPQPEVDGDARAHRDRGAAAGPGRGHDHRHGLVLRRAERQRARRLRPGGREDLRGGRGRELERKARPQRDAGAGGLCGRWRNASS